MPVKEIFYSETYKDDMYEYRHVILPPEQAQLVPRTHLLTETEWRNLGLQMSAGWVHFMLHNPENKNFMHIIDSHICHLLLEPHVLLFRRPLKST
ncbi:unnamed protein product [Rotaria sp. Silwood1]|nr:unnamed protein product [Rotaria sp. Silwood1]